MKIYLNYCQNRILKLSLTIPMKTQIIKIIKIDSIRVENLFKILPKNWILKRSANMPMKTPI